MIKESEHPSVWFFGIISGVFCLLFIVMEVVTFISFKHSEQRIVNHYKDLCSLSESGLSLSASSLDSLASTLEFNVAQRIALQNVAKQVLETSVKESLNAVERNAINKTINTEIYDEVKFLLEDQTAKIEHEYISLEIWCALLTIVFLIFSFFSLLKSDDLVKQGEAGVAELKRMKDEGERSLSDMQEKGSVIIKSMGQAKDNELMKYSLSYKEFIKENRDTAEDAKRQLADISNKIGEFEMRAKEQISENQQSMKREFDSFRSEFDKENATFTQKIKDLNNMLSLLEGRLKNLSSAMDTKDKS